jgi:heterodisulfide reductase subunit A
VCSGCGVCVAVCPYDAIHLMKLDSGLVASVDSFKCKRCGLCSSACPAGAVTINDSLAETIASGYIFLS